MPVNIITITDSDAAIRHGDVASAMAWGDGSVLDGGKAAIGRPRRQINAELNFALV